MSLSKIVIPQEFAFSRLYPNDYRDGNPSLVAVNEERFIDFPLTANIHVNGYQVMEQAHDISKVREYFYGLTGNERLVLVSDDVAIELNESMFDPDDCRPFDNMWHVNLRSRVNAFGVNGNRSTTKSGSYWHGTIYLCDKIDSVSVHDEYRCLAYIIVSQSSHVLEFPPTNAIIIKADRVIYQ